MNELLLAVDTSGISGITDQLGPLATAIGVAILAIGALIIGVAASAGAALKWGPGLVSKFFKK